MRTQIGGFIYGRSPPDNEMVKEIHAIVMPPQIGNHINVNLPINTPNENENPFLSELECLGWIHTQPAELQELSKNDILLHTKYLQNNDNRWVNDQSIVITCSFTPGSVTLTAYRLTPEGFDWGKDNLNKQHIDNNNNILINQRTRAHGMLYEKIQMLLSDRFMGFFMIPDTQSWNRNFVGVTWNAQMIYGVKLGNPLPFYHELHRPTHFLKFASIEREMDNIQNNNNNDDIFNDNDETDQQQDFLIK